MNIIGAKVVLRAVEEKDNELLLKMLNDPSIEALIGGWTFPKSMDSQRDWFLHIAETPNVMRCIVSVDGIAIGMLVLNNIDFKNGTACVNIKLAEKEHRGKGYGTDAVKTVVRYAFRELRLNCVYAYVLEYNQASQRLFDKCGFTRDGILRDRCYKLGCYCGYIAYSILRREFVEQ